MINTVLKNLFSKSATRKYPNVARSTFKDTRGQIRGVDINKCIFCGLCQKKCPSNAIRVDKNANLWEIDRFKCIICAECCRVCPKKCIHMDQEHAPPLYQKRTAKYIK